MTNRETILAAVTGIALLISAPVQAGGPVIIEDKADLVQDDRDRNGAWIVPLLVGIGIIAILSGHGGSSAPCFAPEPETDNGGGC